MVFKRRDARSWLQVMGQILYPKGGWRRAAHYVVHRLRRLPDPPHKIARGVAAGVFVCFTPLFGFHFLLAAALAFLIQGNIVAALLATFIGNPLTFPIIAAFCMEVGEWILGMEAEVPLNQVFVEFSRTTAELWHNVAAVFTDDVMQWNRMGSFFQRVFLPYVVGGILPGLTAGTLAYLLTLPAVAAYQRRRVKKLKERIAKHRKMLQEAEMASAQEEAAVIGGFRESTPSERRDP